MRFALILSVAGVAVAAASGGGGSAKKRAAPTTTTTTLAPTTTQAPPVAPLTGLPDPNPSRSAVPRSR